METVYSYMFAIFKRHNHIEIKAACPDALELGQELQKALSEQYFVVTSDGIRCRIFGILQKDGKLNIKLDVRRRGSYPPELVGDVIQLPEQVVFRGFFRPMKVEIFICSVFLSVFIGLVAYSMVGFLNGVKGWWFQLLVAVLGSALTAFIDFLNLPIVRADEALIKQWLVKLLVK
jgi:hypothetical protein